MTDDRLAESLELFRAVVAGAREGIMVFDRDLRLVAFNGCMEQLTGARAADVLGTRATDPDAGAAWLRTHRPELLTAALQGHATHRDEVDWPTPDGELPRVISDDIAPLRDGSGLVIGVSIAVRDITAAKMAEQMLRQGSQFHRQVIDGALEGIAVVDTNLRYVVFNSFMEELTSTPASRVLGAHPAEVFPDLEADFTPALRAALEGATVFRREVFFPGNGERPARWISDTVSPVRGSDGRIVGAVVSVRDVSDQKRAEHHLRASYDRTSVALASARMGVWEVDLATRAVIWTDNLAALFGRPLEDVAGEFGDGLAYAVPEDADRVREAVDASMATGSALDVSFRITLPDGSLRWMNAVGHVVRGRGRSPRLIGVTTDITERRQLETQVRQSQKMEAVGLLAGGVAHDFNNLLTAILGYSRFLSEGLTDPEQRRDVEEIIKAADRATSLTRQLLTFSRRQPIETSVFSVSHVVAELAVMLRRLIGESVMLATATDAGCVIRADRGQIEQVIVNLVVNARDAMPNGGRITVVVRQVALGAPMQFGSLPLDGGDYVRLQVIDNGSGMDDETKARLFEPLFTTKPVGQGTGLGLATVFGIVSQLRGAIAVDSALGEGTTFSIYLPCTEEELAAAAQSADRVHSGGTETVLLVEDEQPVRVLVRMILERAGYRVFDAGTAEEAERLFDGPAGKAALLVTDVIMPGGRGTELFRRLSARNPSLKGLFVSGHTADASAGVRLAPGQLFLEKPFTAEGLLARVRESLSE